MDISGDDFRPFFEASPSLQVISSTDLTIVAATHAYLRATMLRRADLLGALIFDAFPDNPDDPTADGVRNPGSEHHEDALM